MHYFDKCWWKQQSFTLNMCSTWTLPDLPTSGLLDKSHSSGEPLQMFSKIWFLMLVMISLATPFCCPFDQYVILYHRKGFLDRWLPLCPVVVKYKAAPWSIKPQFVFHISMLVLRAVRSTLVRYMSNPQSWMQWGQEQNWRQGQKVMEPR